MKNKTLPILDASSFGRLLALADLDLASAKAVVRSLSSEQFIHLCDQFKDIVAKESDNQRKIIYLMLSMSDPAQLSKNDAFISGLWQDRFDRDIHIRKLSLMGYSKYAKYKNIKRSSILSIYLLSQEFSDEDFAKENWSFAMNISETDLMNEQYALSNFLNQDMEKNPLGFSLANILIAKMRSKAASAFAKAYLHKDND